MRATILTSPILGPLGPGQSDTWEVILAGQRS